jgi:hypothetical protein
MLFLRTDNLALLGLRRLTTKRRIRHPWRGGFNRIEEYILVETRYAALWQNYTEDYPTMGFAQIPPSLYGVKNKRSGFQ